MTVTEVLEQARALIADEAHWCQDGSAFDSRGMYVLPEEDRAVRWCAVGAIRAACRGRHSIPRGVLTAIRRAGVVLYPNLRWSRDLARRVASVNDDLGHEVVLSLFDRAIVEAQVAEEETP